MTREELDEAARSYILALNQYRQEFPSELTGVLYVGVTSGVVGRYAITANVINPNPYEPGTPEYDAFYVPVNTPPVSTGEF